MGKKNHPLVSGQVGTVTTTTMRRKYNELGMVTEEVVTTMVDELKHPDVEEES